MFHIVLNGGHVIELPAVVKAQPDVVGADKIPALQLFNAGQQLIGQFWLKDIAGFETYVSTPH